MKYSVADHQSFLSAIARKPKDFTSRGAYADWLEENDPGAAGEKTLALMRDPNQPVWVHRDETGRVLAGRRWTMPEIKTANVGAGRNWFDRDSMRFFGTRLLPRHVYSGPGGVYFVHEGDNFDRTAREYRVAMFHPRTGNTGTWGTYHSDPSSGREFANDDRHAHLDDAVDLARRLAAGTSPYPKNQHYSEYDHGPAVEYPPVRTPEPPAHLSRLPRRVVRYSRRPPIHVYYNPVRGQHEVRAWKPSRGDNGAWYWDHQRSERVGSFPSEEAVRAKYPNALHEDHENAPVVGANLNPLHLWLYGLPGGDEAATSHGQRDWSALQTPPENPYNLSRLPRRVVRYSADQGDLTNLMKRVRQDPYDVNLHGAVADALDEVHPGNKVAELIRRQFGHGQYGGQGERSNDWYEPVNNAWDGTFYGHARLGAHGPFNLYLGHEGGPEQTQKWVVHAVSRLPGSRDTGYSFEFPHEEAHLIPHMFPGTRAENFIRGVEHATPEERDREAELFDNAMIAEH